MKAILVMDMPNSCDKCDIICTQYYKAIKDENFENYMKPDNCPLREEPKKKNDNPLASDTMYKYGYSQGYNACIDEILGDKE